MSGLILLGAAGPALADGLPAREPGLWQSTTTVTGPDGQPLANAVNVVTVSCVDALNDQKFFLSNQSACSNLRVSGDGGSYKIDGMCTQSGKPSVIHETLDYADTKDVALTAQLGDMTVHSQLQWQGDCMDGMQPGDEGDIENGAFVKADNINDTADQ
ncbi:MAG: DUF3617 domain-containing protein [Acidocella sp.]|uniref:DUF3617 domain-containing protein n=1 Tax=Acidocella sp. TaxID=50710 RepID=UPI003FD76D32